MGKFLESLMGFILLPLIILNTFGIFVGIIWLLFLGQWGIVIGVVIAYIISTWILGLLLMIPMPVQFLAVYFSNKKKYILMSIFGFVGYMITSFIILSWVLGSFNFAISIHQDGLPLLPLLLVGYSLAVGPFAYMARGEDNESYATHFQVFITQLIFIGAVILYFLGWSNIIFIYGIIISLILDIILLVLLNLVTRESHRAQLIYTQEEMLISTLKGD